MRLVRLAERVAGDRMQVRLGGRLVERLVQGRFPGGRSVDSVDPRRRRDPQVRRDQLEVGPLVPELVDGRAVEVARHQQVGKGDRQEPTQLLGVGPRVADGRRQQRGQAREAVQRRSLGALERALDERRRRRGAPLELSQATVVRGALPIAVVQVDQAEQPVADQQWQAKRRLDLVAADEGGVDLRRRIARDQALACDGKPDGRSVLVDAELVRHLALPLV